MTLELNNGRNSPEALIEALQPLLSLLKLFASLPEPRLTLATEVLSGLLANPDYCPDKQPGEPSEHAYARRALDYTEALVAEHARRQDVAKEKEPTP
jgi:hypothetical protein